MFSFADVMENFLVSARFYPALGTISGVIPVNLSGPPGMEVGYFIIISAYSPYYEDYLTHRKGFLEK